MSRTFSVSASLLLIHALAHAGGFAPNHMFVSTSEGKIVEFDEAGDHVRTIPVVSATNALRGLVFAPDGDLLVADQDGDRILSVSEDGHVQVVASAVVGIDHPSGLTLGPRGQLYVVSPLSSTVDVYARSGSGYTFVDSLAVATTPNDALIDASGDLFVASNFPPQIQRYNESHAFVDAVGALFTTAGPMATWQGGAIVVSDFTANTIRIRGIETFSTLPSDPAIVGPWGLTAAPNGNLVVACYGGDRVVAIGADGTVQRVWNHPDLVGPSHVVFAPFRFTAKVKATLLTLAHAPVKAKDKTAVVSISPGTGTVVVTSSTLPDTSMLPGGPPVPTPCVLRGAEVLHDTPKSRTCFGTAHTTPSSTISFIAARLLVTGASDAHGNFVVKKVKGPVSATGFLGGIEGSLATTTPIP